MDKVGVSAASVASCIVAVASLTPCGYAQIQAASLEEVARLRTQEMRLRADIDELEADAIRSRYVPASGSYRLS
jgi:hypothetical protein